MSGGLLFRCEQACAFERDVDPEILPGELCRVAHSQHLDRPDPAIDGVALDSHFARETSMYRIEAQQVSIGFGRCKIVDSHNRNVIALALHDGAQHIAADAAEPVDTNP